MFGQHFYKSALIFIVAATLMGTPLVSARQKQNTSSDKSSAPTVSTTKVVQVKNASKTPPAEFKPYVALITADDVYIRSGPASIYYPVGKALKGQKVIVRQVKYGKHNWAMIEPTSQCFSYIAKEFVRPEKLSIATADATPPNNTSSKTITTGVVTGNAVRVRAGSIKVPPANANQVQARLNEGAIVNIIGQRDDFYKIVSPADSYFWVSLDFVKQTGPVTEQQLATSRQQISQNILDNSFDPTGNSGPTSPQYKEYSKLMTIFTAEQKKPLRDRNFKPIIASLDKLIANTKTGAVHVNSKRLQHNVLRADEAQNALKLSLDQDQKLRLTLAKIDAEVQNLVEIGRAHV